MMKKGIIFLFICMTVSADSVEYSLQDLVIEGLKSAYRVEQASSEIEKAAAVISQARSAVIPDITASFTKSEIDNTEMREDSYLFELQLTQPLYTGGKTQAAYDVARLGKKTAEYSYEQSRQETAFRITEAYFNTLKALDYLSITKDSLKLLEQQKITANANYRAGTAIKSDVLRVEVRQAEIYSEIAAAQGQLKKAKEALNFAVGKRLPEPYMLKKETEEYALEKYDGAYDSRFDVKAMENMVKTSQKYRTIARGDQRPSVAFFFMNQKSGSDFPPENRQWQGGIKAEWNLFDGGYIRGKVEEADAAFKKTNQQYREMIDGVRFSVESAQADMESAHNRVSAAKKGIELAEESYRLTESRFSSGLIPSVDLLDDELALRRARTQYSNALFDSMLAAARLLYENGHIFDFFKDKI